MDSLPTGSDRILEIRSAYADLVIKPKGRQISAPVSGAGSSSLRVFGADLEAIRIPGQNVSEDYTDHKGNAIHELKVFPLFFEQTDYNIMIRSRNGEALEFSSNSSLIAGSVGRAYDDDPAILNGTINFGNNVGFSDLNVSADGKMVLSARVEVYPTKVSYKDDYMAMMKDINDMVSESVLDFLRKTYQVFVPDHKRNNVPAVFFTVLQTIYDDYMKAANRIISVPHHKLVSEHEVLHYYKVKRTDSQSEKWLVRHPEHFRNDGGKLSADKILALRKRITFDTQENRLVKFMLQSTVRRIEDFTARYKASSQHPDETILAGAAKMKNELRRLLTTTFLSEVSDYSAAESMSLVFGMAPGYRELYKYYLMLLNGISMTGDVFKMSVRETAQLYEYWCFIKLYDILRSRYELKSPDIIKVDRKGVTVDIAKGRQNSRVVFLNGKTGEQIFLTYNPTETHSPTGPQKPDNVLELAKGKNNKYKYVFDAKYRIEMNPDGVYYPDTKPGPKMDDINTMHRYRDSIVYENPNSRFTFEKTMFGAYILFPYTDESEYENHRFYKSIEKVNIGGLPFLPSATNLVTKLLDDLVSDSPEAAFERAVLPRGIEERLRKVDWDKRDVLIGLVNDEDHLDLFLQNNLYFTRRFDIAKLPVHYVALYEKGKGILRYGEVIRWRKAIRRELPGNSAFADQEYHVFDVLKWEKLPEQLAVAGVGPNPVAYTNFFLLTNSTLCSELMLKNEESYRFNYELRRRMEQITIGENNNVTAFEFAGAKVFFDNDRINVIVGDKLLESCDVREFRNHPGTTFRRLQRLLEAQSAQE